MLIRALYRQAVLSRLVGAGLMSRGTAQRELERPLHGPQPYYLDIPLREREHIIDCVQRGFLSYKTAMGKLGVENPKREFDDINMERLQQDPRVQTFIRQTAQQLARAKQPWKYA